MKHYNVVKGLTKKSKTLKNRKMKTRKEPVTHILKKQIIVIFLFPRLRRAWRLVAKNPAWTLTSETACLSKLGAPHLLKDRPQLGEKKTEMQDSLLHVVKS